MTQEVGESRTFQTPGVAVVGLFRRLATAAAQQGVSDEDPTWYQTTFDRGRAMAGVFNPFSGTPQFRAALVDIELATNGVDADTPVEAARVAVGDVVTWTYVVTNLSGGELTEGMVIDNNGTPADASDDFIVVLGLTLSPMRSSHSRRREKRATDSSEIPPSS